jgi:hypothetical protein
MTRVDWKMSLVHGTSLSNMYVSFATNENVLSSVHELNNLILPVDQSISKFPI